MCPCNKYGEFMKKFFILLAVVGMVIPYIVFIVWLLENGFNVHRFIAEAIATNISLFAWLDVIISAVALITLAYCCKTIIGKRGFWLIVLLTLTIGPSCGLPVLALYLLKSRCCS